VPHAPLLDLDLVAEGVSAGANRTYRPVVLMHGLGDAGSNAGMQSLAQSVMKAYPGSYAVAVNVAGACARKSSCRRDPGHAGASLCTGARPRFAGSEL
jgi:hypothetical protein